MSTEHIVTELQDHVLTIRLNRPDKKNALTQAMYTAMAEALLKADTDDAVRSILFTGTPDCFCSGNDIQDFLQMPPSSKDAPVARFMLALASARKPVVAALNGPAVGVGTTLLLHVDLAYAGESTRFHMPFVNIGICPEFASSLLLPQMIGHAQAAELVMLAEPFTAQKALECKLINAVLPNDQVLEHARAKAVKLAQQPPQALRTTKALLRRWTSARIEEAILAEADQFMPMLKGPEALEALTAFLQKRKPDFSKFG